MGKLVVCLFYVSLTVVVGFVSGQPITSCSQTPYPDVCSSVLSSASLAAEGKTTFSFAQLSLRAAMQRAKLIRTQASAVDLQKLDPRSRAAWQDCLELSDQTISHLNRLVADMAERHHRRHQTCLNGFQDFDLGSRLASSPFVSSNISQMLSNSLAVTKSNVITNLGGGSRRLLSQGFPTWVSAADRKLLQSSSVKADVVVAKDGSGNYKTISEAVAAASKRSGSGRFVIQVKAGVYSENVQITGKNIMLVGDGIDQTVVTGNKNVQDGSTTFQSATVAAVGDGFIARDITFQNTAGAAKHQAVAFRSGADLSVFYRCSFKGYQDTLYVHSQRQFYRDCDIYGTVDFIFGDAVTVLQNCNIFVRKPMSNQKNTITAQGRSDPNENTGISIHNSRVTAASDLKPVQGSFKTFLGRPWKQYSRTVFMKSTLDGLIDPAGWLEWSGSFALKTLYYGEYQNTGAGAGTSGRVKWGGYRVITSATEAGKFTVGSFLGAAHGFRPPGSLLPPGFNEI
ncbi:unnamed protein product [Spirodela intermedia]|uniref:Pectinesterase n=1 Tax=Spirodela intermedia TaxID=51605 RepID=A0A7I8J5X5_SPIIN|nr:unnamed protein product [Spirodela intermedia]CAA6664803.1 unnamed protein product [Spirodela intermedia]